MCSNRKSVQKKDVKIIANFPYDDFNKLEIRYLNIFTIIAFKNVFL